MRTICCICLLWLGCLSLTMATWNSDVATNNALCTAENDQLFPTLVPDDAGGCYIFWQDARGSDRDIYAQHLDATGNLLWTADGLVICAETGAQGWPEAISDGQGGAIVVWGEGRHGNQDFYAQRVNADGTLLWTTEGIPVCVEPTLQEDLALVPDGAGGAIAAWEDWRNGNQDIYAQHLDAEGTRLWGENGVPVCQIPGDQYDPLLISDGEGGAIAAWWDISTADWDITVQRLNAAGEPLWGEAGTPVCHSPGNQGGPVAVTDGQGGALMVWTDYRADALGDLYAQHIGPEGVQMWPSDGLPICVLPNAQQQPTLIRDGEGGLIVTWWDERNLYSDIYAQRIRHDGTILWQQNGLPVCVAEGAQREPQIVTTDQGACIFWKDYREDYGMVTLDHIYAQSLDRNGNVFWQLDGIPVTTAEGEQSQPRGIWMSQGLAVAWGDRRSGQDADIYLQWIATR